MKSLLKYLFVNISCNCNCNVKKNCDYVLKVFLIIYFKVLLFCSDDLRQVV